MCPIDNELEPRCWDTGPSTLHNCCTYSLLIPIKPAFPPYPTPSPLTPRIPLHPHYFTVRSALGLCPLDFRAEIASYVSYLRSYGLLSKDYRRCTSQTCGAHLVISTPLPLAHNMHVHVGCLHDRRGIQNVPLCECLWHQHANTHLLNVTMHECVNPGRTFSL